MKAKHTKTGSSMDLQNIQVKVDRVVVEGVGRTKDHVVTNSVKRILDATNFEEMLRLSHESKMHLDKLGVFKNIDISIDTGLGGDSSADTYDVVFGVTEHRRVTGSVNTLVGTNDASMSIGAALPNMSGRGDKMNLQYTHGTRSTRAANVLFSKPIDSNPDIVFSCSGSQNQGDFPWSAYKETDRMTHADFTFPSLLGVHTFRWEGVWRDLTAFPSAAFPVRENAGHSLKSSISHSVSRDSRDNDILPTKGGLLKFIQEYAGIGGDVQFEKHQLQIQLNQSLFKHVIAQLTLDTGVITSQTGEKQRINDLFMLGGPLSFRGFNLKGVGPSQEGSVKCYEIKVIDTAPSGHTPWYGPTVPVIGPLGDMALASGSGHITYQSNHWHCRSIPGCMPLVSSCSLGGDTYWKCGAHIYTPLPFTPGKGGFGEHFRSHFFVTAGSLVNRREEFERGSTWKETLTNLGQSTRLSYGAGIVLRMGGLARMELNYVVPVLVQRGDSVCSGVQFGIGIWYS